MAFGGSSIGLRSGRTAQGHYLMQENPIRGYEIPTEKNPRRPVASTDRYDAIRKISDQLQMEIRWNGRRDSQRSYLSELLDIVNGTGRRISAVCQLRYENLRLSEGPYGSIRWPADTDKGGRETCVPISPSVRHALDRVLRDRPGIGSAPLLLAAAQNYTEVAGENVTLGGPVVRAARRRV